MILNGNYGMWKLNEINSSSMFFALLGATLEVEGKQRQPRPD